MAAKYALKTARKMKITASLFDAGLKCLTKCFLRSLGEAGTGNAYAEWVRTKSVSYHREGIKRLMARAAHGECIRDLSGTGKLKTVEWRFAVDFVAHSKNLESSIHALERIPSEGRARPAQVIPIRFTFFNKLTRDDKLLLAFDALVLSEMLGLYHDKCTCPLFCFLQKLLQAELIITPPEELAVRLKGYF
jgi:hypothetical protein